MKLQISRVLGFLICLCVTTCLMAKPIVDLRDSTMWMHHLSHYDRPEYILNTQGKKSHVVVLTDLWLHSVSLFRGAGYERVVAFLLEPRAIHPMTYDYVSNHMDAFDLVLTFDRELLDRFPEKCQFVHACGLGDVFREGIHPKTKLCSMTPSKKNWTDGHQFRLQVFERFKHQLDGYKDPDTAWARWIDPWVNDFCFQVVVENSKQAHYFSEKIVKLFKTGTVPIYWGCPTIGQFFDMDGIITFNSIEELDHILKNLSFEEYYRRMPAIRKNFEIAARYPQSYLSHDLDRPDTIDSLWVHLKRFFPAQGEIGSPIEKAL
jgi:hypothetical protein